MIGVYALDGGVVFPVKGFDWRGHTTSVNVHCLPPTMETVQADLGSTTCKDGQEPIQPATHNMEDGQQERSDPIFSEIVSFTFASFLFTLMLVNRVL